MEYNFRDIEKKWQDWWKANKVYQVSNQSEKPKHFVLDMFPYPSGAGLHVGHPLGYIASDIYSRRVSKRFGSSLARRYLLSKSFRKITPLEVIIPSFS